MNVRKTIQLLRVKEWFFSKIPFMFVPVLFLGNQAVTEINDSIIFYCSYFLYLFFFYGFGYAINDYSDRAADKVVGKTNIMGELSEVSCRLVLFFLIAGGFQFGIYCRRFAVFLALAFVYFWGAAYSVKPFRFKEKGVLGLLVSSLAQRTIPLVPLLGISLDFCVPVVLCGVSGFLVGLRYILIHQYEDMDHDCQSGINTFVKNGNHNIKAMIYTSLVIEVVLLLLMNLLYIRTLTGILLFAVCMLQSCMTYYTVQYVYAKEYFVSFICTPLEDMYNFYLPLTCLLVLIPQNVVWGGMIILLCLISFSAMKEKWKIAAFCITHRRKRR